jgi:hypothetical protein
MAQDSQNQQQPGTPDCSVVHQTVSGAPGWLGANWPLSGIGGVTWLKITGLSGGAPDCPVSLQRPHPSTSATNSSLSGKGESTAAKIHRTVRWRTRLSGESEPPAVNGLLRDQRATCGEANSQMVAPDSVRCANRSEDPTVGFARKGKRPCTGQL